MNNNIDYNFANFLRKWVKRKFGDGYGYLKAAGDELGVGKVYLGNILAGRRSTPEEKKREIARKIGVPYEEMIGIESGPASCAEQPSTYTATEKDPIMLEHYRIVQEFHNKQLALEINKNLIKIEKLNPVDFKDLSTFIKIRADEIEKKALSEEIKRGTPEKGLENGNG